MTHASDHNAIHSVVGLSLPTNLTTGSTGHVAAHNTIHSAITSPDLVLPTNLSQGSVGHTANHATISTWVANATPGIRGLWGPQSNTANVPGYPGSFNATIGSGGTYATVAAAISAEGNNSVMQLLAQTHTLSAAVNPKQGQQFWGHPSGATVTGSTGINGFDDGAASTRQNVIIKNITFTGLSNPVRNGTSTGWVVAYCDFSGSSNAGVYGRAATYVHHSIFHAVPNSVDMRTDGTTMVMEDNEIYALNNSEGHKIATRYANTVFRHNWVHDNNVGAQCGVWLDTGAVDQTPDNAIIEWNLIEGSSWGIVVEADFGGTKVRYNTVRTNTRTGIKLQATSGCEVYQNVLTGNMTGMVDGPTLADLLMYVEGGDINAPQRAWCENNSWHHNNVTVTGAYPQRAAGFQFYDPTVIIADKNPWRVDNTKNNNWDYNTYHLGSRLSASDVFAWAAEKSFTQWQALLQGPGGTGATFDVHGSAVT
jgi:parallel beta-helix repeat protein